MRCFRWYFYDFKTHDDCHLCFPMSTTRTCSHWRKKLPISFYEEKKGFAFVRLIDFFIIIYSWEVVFEYLEYCESYMTLQKPKSIIFTWYEACYMYTYGRKLLPQVNWKLHVKYNCPLKNKNKRGMDNFAICTHHEDLPIHFIKFV